MTAGDGSVQVKASWPPWSNLADEVLALVRLKVSLRDRVRIAAVCRSWGSLAARHPAEPAVPLLLIWPPHKAVGSMPERLYSPEDGGLFYFELPREVWYKRIVGSYDGGWIAACGDDDELMIVNLFSDTAATFSVEYDFDFDSEVCKIVFSEAPTSGACVLAGITVDRLNIAMYRVGCLDGGWTATEGLFTDTEELTDIAFCGGELYGMCASKKRTMLKLFKFDIGVNDDGAPVVIAAQQLGEQLDIGMRATRNNEVRGSYIVNLHDKPSIAVEAQWLPNLGPFFKVFLLVGDDDDDYRWEEMVSLGDYALFVSPTCSKAVEAGGHMQGNTVYYSCDRGYSGTCSQ